MRERVKIQMPRGLLCAFVPVAEPGKPRFHLGRLALLVAVHCRADEEKHRVSIIRTLPDFLSENIYFRIKL